MTVIPLPYMSLSLPPSCPLPGNQHSSLFRRWESLICRRCSLPAASISCVTASILHMAPVNLQRAHCWAICGLTCPWASNGSRASTLRDPSWPAASHLSHPRSGLFSPLTAPAICTKATIRRDATNARSRSTRTEAILLTEGASGPASKEWA